MPDNTPVTQALEPCPFCGGEAQWKEDPGVCDVPFGLVVEHQPSCFLGLPKSESAALAAWNHRHRQSSSNAGGVEVEQAAWDWLSEKFLNIEAGHDPADRDYSADEMVDAFIAGVAVSRPLYSSEDVERVATAIRDVKQGLGFDYMDFCRDAARAALASLSTPTAEPMESDGG